MGKFRTGMQLVLVAGLSMIGTGVVAAESMEKITETVDRVLDRDTTTIHFSKGSAALSDNDRAALVALVEKSKNDANVDRFDVAAWSDRDYPAMGKTLSKAQRKLADDRKDNVKKVLKDAGAKTVDTYSFAEHPAWLAKVFNTDNSKIKGEGDRVKSLSDQQTASIGKKLRAKGGPDTAVIMIKYTDGSAH